jgi:hypothetical protein
MPIRYMEKKVWYGKINRKRWRKRICI